MAGGRGLHRQAVAQASADDHRSGPSPPDCRATISASAPSSGGLVGRGEPRLGAARVGKDVPRRQQFARHADARRRCLRGSVSSTKFSAGEVGGVGRVASDPDETSIGAGATATVRATGGLPAGADKAGGLSGGLVCVSGVGEGPGARCRAPGWQAKRQEPGTREQGTNSCANAKRYPESALAAIRLKSMRWIKSHSGRSSRTLHIAFSFGPNTIGSAVSAQVNLLAPVAIIQTQRK